MNNKLIFIQLNEESQFETIKITRKLSDLEDLVDRQRKGLIIAIKNDFGKTLPDFLKDLNNFYKSNEISLLSNQTVLMIYRKWRVNKSILEVLSSLFAEIKDIRLIENKDFLLKLIKCVELDVNCNFEHTKFKVWLTSKIFLKVNHGNNFENLEMFLKAIWHNYMSLYNWHVPDVFQPKKVESQFKPIWVAFEIFRKRKAQPEIYLTFFSVFFIKLSEPVLSEKDFSKFIRILFERNKIEIALTLSINDYIRLFNLYKISEPLFLKIPDLSEKDDEYCIENRASVLNPYFELIYNFYSNYGISYFFIYNFLFGRLNNQERKWFCDVLNGNNLVYSENIPFKLTKKVSHFFNVLPADREKSSYQSFYEYIQMHYGFSGGNFSLTQSLIYCAIYIEVRDSNFTQEAIRNLRSTDNLDFWISTLCILHHKGLRANNLNQVIDYIDDQVIRNGRVIDFKKKKLSNLEEEAFHWHEAIALMRTGKYKRITKLPKSNIDKYSIEHRGKKYTISQLLTNKELIEEGRTLFHCVGTYTDNCIERGSFVFSLRLDYEKKETIPLITIEVRDGKIYQSRGKRNRNCSKDEEFIIQGWAKENKLKFL